LALLAMVVGAIMGPVALLPAVIAAKTTPRA
jgi:hypothetical protein